MRTDEGEQHHGGDVARILKATTFATLHDEAVDTGVYGLEGGTQCGDDVKDGEPGFFEGRGVLGRVAGRSGYKLHVVRYDKLHDVGVTHEGLGDVDTKGLVGEFPHEFNLTLDVVKLARGSLNDAEAAGVGNGTGECAARDPAHGCLQDWFFDS